MLTNGYTVRDYTDDLEESWLRCRVLGFLDTAYFDDVWRRRPTTEPGLGLVVVAGDEVVGICDASVEGSLATIDTIVVHPDHRRHGIAGVLLDELVGRLRERPVIQVDAWTRDDAATHAWYSQAGFEIAYRYLHVYAASPDEMARAADARPGLTPRAGHFHAEEGHEDDLRARFARVHACHRFLRSI